MSKLMFDMNSFEQFKTLFPHETKYSTPMNHPGINSNLVLHVNSFDFSNFEMHYTFFRNRVPLIYQLPNGMRQYEKVIVVMQSIREKYNPPTKLFLLPRF